MFTLPLILNALRVHCGYDNSRLFALLGFNPTLTLPLCTDAERTHDMHHRYNMCNYGGAYFFCQSARVWGALSSVGRRAGQDGRRSQRNGGDARGGLSVSSVLISALCSTLVSALLFCSSGDRLLGTWMDPDQEVADKKAGKKVQAASVQKYDDAAVAPAKEE